ncbi:hypothetical protein ACVRY7_06405 [Streptococcus ictaluri]|uniref:Membrane protein n=1 Tax=Streptococcus ictaluri 707-05 TaxID=764299 RepID=G5K529_9STRE|nr:hypothetical protein [Streptococcus ictaluri]EHI68947.1 putative membrane protein [Streptococcus ictaluri 707-05]
MKKQNIVKNQWIAIGITGPMALVSLIAAGTAQNPFQQKICGIASLLLVIILILLLWGLKSAKKMQDKLEAGCTEDKDVQKLLKTPVYDERQKLLVSKSYQYGFWTILFLLWVQSVLGRFWSETVSAEFMALLTMYTGSTVSANLNGASPFVDQRFGHIGKIITLPTILLGLLSSLGAIWAMTKASGLAQVFGHSGAASMFCLGVSLIAMGVSIVIGRRRFNEEE